MKPDAAVANPTTISSAALVGVDHSADAAAKTPNTLVKRISNPSVFLDLTSVQFLQSRLHRLRQVPLERPSSPGEFPVAGEAGWQVHQNDDRDDADRDFLNPVRERDGQAAEAHALFQVAKHLDQRGNHDDAGNGTAEAVHAANHQHRQGDECRAQIERARIDDTQEVRIERAGETYDEGADDEGDQSLADDIDSRGAGGDCLIAGGAKRQAGAGDRVEIGDYDGDRRTEPSVPDIHGGRRADNRTLSTRHRVPVRIDVVDDAEQPEGGDRGGDPR